jgi:hypothetical protein
MKNLVLIFILSCLAAKSQDFKLLGNVVITSKGYKKSISLDGSPNIEKGKNIGNVKTEIVTNNSSSENSVYREMKISNSTDKVTVQLEIKRIVQKKGDFFAVDTDAPFVSDERNKRITDHYLQFIQQPLWLVLYPINDSIVIQSSKLPIMGQWNFDLPRLNKVLAFSGIFLNPEKFDSLKWKDEIIQGNNVFHNSFQVINSKEDILEIQVSGYAENTKKESNTNDSKPNNQIPNVGDNLNALSLNLLERYEGRCSVEAKTGLIVEMTLKVAKSDVLKVLGQEIPQTTESNFTIVNKRK